MKSWKAAWIALLGAIASCSHAQGVSMCGSLENGYGPFDYRVERDGKLHVVDKYHFTPPVEALIRGSSGYLGDDLSYTLRAAPNHHRALMAVIRYVERTKSPQPPFMQYSIDCYFDRALRFQPDDTVVRTMFARYLGEKGRLDEARAQLLSADQYAKDNALSHYNIGLVYFEIKDYDRSLAQAHKAAALGYERPELPNMLKSVGAWRERPPAEPSPPSSAPQ